MTRSSLWPPLMLALLLLLDAFIRWLALHFAIIPLLRILPLLERSVQRLVLMGSLVILMRFFLHSLDFIPFSYAFSMSAIPLEIPLTPDTPGQTGPSSDDRLGAALAFSIALRETRKVRARIELKQGKALITLPAASSLELPAHSLADQRLAMVIARLFKNGKGRPLFEYKELSTAFGKNNRQDSQNHMGKLKYAGGSLVQMILRGLPGRPRPLHPVVEKRVASFWERDPLASHIQCHQWLAAHPLPDGIPIPSPELLARLKFIPGNLVTVRHALTRQLERARDPYVVRQDALISRLFEVIDAQDNAMMAAGVHPVPRPGLVELVSPHIPESPFQHTRTSRALTQAIAPLTRPLSADEDKDLMAQVGLDQLAPLHCATLYCTLRLSIGQIAALVGHSKSVVYRALLRFARTAKSLDLFPPATHFSGVLGLDEKWLRISKSYSKQERLEGKKWRYAHFAVDALTGDLLHVDVYEASDRDHARAFLVALRAMGIRPRVVVTDMWAGYHDLLRTVFGERVIHHFCLFHHLQAVRDRLRQKCGKDWQRSPILRDFVERVDHIYNCNDRRTAKKRLEEVLTLRPLLAEHHPEALPVLELLEMRFPKVANALGSRIIPTTNNITERTIKAFNQHYKRMAGLESLETARIQLVLFRFFYRLTPQRETVRKEDRGKCPLERAGWEVRGIPVADYIRDLTQALDDDPPEPLSDRTSSRSPPSEGGRRSEAIAA